MPSPLFLLSPSPTTSPTAVLWGLVTYTDGRSECINQGFQSASGTTLLECCATNFPEYTPVECPYCDAIGGTCPGEICEDLPSYWSLDTASGSVCTNDVDSTSNGCGTSSNDPCSLAACCQEYQSTVPAGDCKFYDKCNRVPTIVYVPDYPVFQPTGDVDADATFQYKPLANDYIEDGLEGDVLVLDEVFMVEWKTDGSEAFRALPVPLPAPVIDDNDNIINWPSAGSCTKLNNETIQYTSPARYTDTAACGYSVKILRIVDGVAIYVKPVKTRSTGGARKERNLRSLQAVCPAGSVETGVNGQGVVCCPTDIDEAQGCFYPNLNAAPTDSPTTSPTNSPSTR